MYISKRGPQFVLVATLLVMLSPMRCAHVQPRPSGRGAQEAPRSPRVLRSSRDGKTTTYVYLYNSRHGRYVSMHRRRRKYQVSARFNERNNHTLLRFETDSVRDDRNLLINIYNEQSKRYICFDKRGRVRTARHVNPRRQRRLSCRFYEELDPSTKTFHYVADQQKPEFRDNRLLSFCGKRRRAMLQKRGSRSDCYTFMKSIRGRNHGRPQSRSRRRHHRRHRRTYKE